MAERQTSLVGAGGPRADPSPEDHEPLAPLPKRVADDLGGSDERVVDPVDFAEQLLERAGVLLSTLESDVKGLQADQHDERVRIEQEWKRQQEAVDIATDRLARMRSHAQQIAAHKARLAEFEVAMNPVVPPPRPEVVTSDSFLGLMAALDEELRAARGITGAIRLPQIARLLNEAAVALAWLAEQADVTKQQLLARTDDELDAEGKEARASFEIGLSILRRDLEVLAGALPLVARPWDDAAWAEWRPPERAVGWVRVGVHTHTRLPDTPIPLLLPVTCGPGLLIEGGPHRDLAVDGIRSVVLRLLGALPPGMARFTFVDPKGMGETVAPFLALTDYDASLVGDGAIVLEAEIEAHLEGLTRHVERVIKHCLQGRFATLDAYHESLGEVVEPYRFLVVFDHPAGFTDRATTLLRALIESGPRCGVTTLVVKPPRAKSSVYADQGLPALPTIKSTADGLVVESSRSGRWSVVPDDPPLLAMGATGDGAGIYERVIAETGTLAREARRAPVGLPAVFALVADASRRRLRDDLPVCSSPVDPDRPETWWTGDATTGIGLPVGRTDGRQAASPWLDETHAGLVVTGRPHAGVSTALRSLVDALAVVYPPEECQVLLVGLGDRSAFTTFGDEALPHARLVATEAERELAVSVLEAAVAIAERRRVRLAAVGTERVGLAGHRDRTGERLPRLLVAIDGVADLFVSDDPVAATASRLLRRLAGEGPPLGVHLLLADRLGADEEEALLSSLPTELGVRIHVGAPADEDDTAGPGSAAMTRRGLDGETRLRVASSSPHQRAITARDLRSRAEAQGFTAVPQVLRGDRGAELARAPLRQLGGEAGRRSDRRTPRIWLGEPVGLGAPVEVMLRRQEGANLVVVSDAPALGQGSLFAAVATASMVHDRSLEVWVVDFLPLEAGFGASFLGLGARSSVHVGRRRNLAKTLDTVHRLVQDRLVSGEPAGAPRLLVVNGLGRAHDFDAAVGEAVVAGAPHPLVRSVDGLDPVGVLQAILRDGPEVGVHTLVWCDTLELLHRRLGSSALGEFGLRVGTAMAEDDSLALLDSSSAATLRAGHGLLYDEHQGRLVKFRPYSLPPDGWTLPA